ncbi:MAG: precorrin-3B C(17)-methyltransferase [Myxococcales bacterium]
MLVETEGVYYLVGNTKRPVDFEVYGLVKPSVIDALSQPYVRLETLAEVKLEAPWLRLGLEGEPLPRLLAERLLIQRNGSVSDRLWRLICGHDDADDEGLPESIEARWFVEAPERVWDVVRDTVLRCT